MMLNSHGSVTSMFISNLVHLLWPRAGIKDTEWSSTVFKKIGSVFLCTVRVDLSQQMEIIYTTIVDRSLKLLGFVWGWDTEKVTS